ncbi:DUF2953 domain-containing protein [Anoxybacteroides tepidamans]|uniref:DUF2953 domain-containing protein n=1 Tax=Anoxybacteroides tepidamans TaxID=265948 RepID=UPI00047FD044|nr:DUF2953 domain-containing protein [Anoxybacillus tepidamans]
MKIVVVIIPILFVFFMLMKLSITIFFHHAQDDDECRITIKTLFGLIRYTIRIPLIKIDKQSASIVVSHKETINNKSNNPTKRKKYSPKEIIDSFKETKEFAQHVIHLHVIVRKFMAHVSVTKLEWCTKIGTGDAAQTGMIVGFGWSVKYGIIALVSKYMKLKAMPLLSITPSFQQPVSEMKFVCMIHFRIGHAMLAGIRILKYWRGNRSKLKSFINRQANESY